MPCYVSFPHKIMMLAARFMCRTSGAWSLNTSAPCQCSRVSMLRPKMFSRELPDAAWHGIPCRGPSTRLTRSSLGLGQDDRVLVAWLKLAFSRVRPSLRRVDESRFAVSKPYPTHTASCPKRAKAARSGARSHVLAFSGRKHLAISHWQPLAISFVWLCDRWS
jgi:hypothetical protein